MPKLKTNRGAAKRFKMTKSGKIKKRKSSASHLLSKKSPKRKRSLREWTLVAPCDEKQLRRIIPYL